MALRIPMAAWMTTLHMFFFCSFILLFFKGLIIFYALQRYNIAKGEKVDTSRLSTDSVQILSKVEMTNLTNKAKMTYTIVSESEANLREGKISIQTPIAQGLLNHKVGDEVEVKIPRGTIKLRIDKITVG